MESVLTNMFWIILQVHGIGSQPRDITALKIEEEHKLKLLKVCHEIPWRCLINEAEPFG